MKICTYCNSQYDDSEIICRKCGNNLVDAGLNQGYAPAGYAQAPQNPQPQYQPPVQSQPYQQAPQQPYQAPVTPPAKKGGIQWWHILLIVLAVLIIGGLIAGIVAVGVIGNSDAPVEDVYEEVEDVDDEEDVTEEVAADEDEEPVEVPTTAAPVEYTVGESVNGVYTNEWADLRIDFSGWTDGTAEEYSAYAADGKTDCWLVAKDFDSLTQVVILAEPLYGLTTAYTETEYLDIVMSQITPVYDSYDLDYSIGEYYEEEIAGKTYECVYISVTSTNTNIEYKTVKIDNYMVSFIITNSAGDQGSVFLPVISEY